MERREDLPRERDISDHIGLLAALDEISVLSVELEDPSTRVDLAAARPDEEDAVHALGDDLIVCCIAVLDERVAHPNNGRRTVLGPGVARDPVPHGCKRLPVVEVRGQDAVADDLGPPDRDALGVDRHEPELVKRRIVHNDEPLTPDPLTYPSPENRGTLANEVALARVADSLVGEDAGEFRIEYSPVRPAFREFCIEQRDCDLPGLPAEVLLTTEVEPGDDVVPFASHLHHPVSRGDGDDREPGPNTLIGVLVTG